MPQERTLGVKWCAEQNRLSIEPVKSEFQNIKRGILSTSSSVFDSLDIAVPYVIKAKLIIQELWRRHTEWDDELPNDILQKWQSWKEGLKASRTIAIPRWYGFRRDECQNVQLHVFCDASEIAYQGVAYFHTVTRECFNVSFIISKTRLAPIKALIVARQELQAAVMASRLKSKIFEEIDLEID